MKSTDHENAEKTFAWLNFSGARGKQSRTILLNMSWKFVPAMVKYDSKLGITKYGSSYKHENWWGKFTNRNWNGFGPKAIRKNHS